MKINIVGDLSLQDPKRLQKVMDAAEDCDILIHAGDIHPGYDIVRQSSVKRQLLAVPGNHDSDWDTRLPGWPRQWRYETNEVLLIGLDNSKDTFSEAEWDLLHEIPTNKPVFLVVHKPLSRIVLIDGTESSHCMGEGNPNESAQRLMNMLDSLTNVALIHGHYHGWALMKTTYGTCLIEGRGGAAPELGYTTIYVTKDGWTAYRHDLDGKT